MKEPSCVIPLFQDGKEQLFIYVSFFPKTEQMLAVNATYSVPGYISRKDLYLPEIVIVFSVTYQSESLVAT